METRSSVGLHVHLVFVCTRGGSLADEAQEDEGRGGARHDATHPSRHTWCDVDDHTAQREWKRNHHHTVGVELFASCVPTKTDGRRVQRVADDAALHVAEDRLSTRHVPQTDQEPMGQRRSSLRRRLLRIASRCCVRLLRRIWDRVRHQALHDGLLGGGRGLLGRRCGLGDGWMDLGQSEAQSIVAEPRSGTASGMAVRLRRALQRLLPAVRAPVRGAVLPVSHLAVANLPRDLALLPPVCSGHVLLFLHHVLGIQCIAVLARHGNVPAAPGRDGDIFAVLGAGWIQSHAESDGTVLSMTRVLERGSASIQGIRRKSVA